MPTDIIANKYKIVREIARSNDVVYEAQDTTMGRRLAIKELVIPANLTGQARRERIERFNREARATGKLAHPNIVTVYDYGEDNGRYFIAMEYLDGGTLRDTLQARGALSIQEALGFADQILAALAHAHAHQVIHRDVKPENIHISPGGHIKLTDFGIARLTEEASLTGDGQVFGTPSYMSPEQIVGRFIDHRTDLFSVAIVLYEMLAGRKPFTGDSVISITHNIVNNDPPPLHGVPFAVEQVIFRALSKDPVRRYNSAEEMRSELKNAASSPHNTSAPGLPGLAAGMGSGALGGFGSPPTYGAPGGLHSPSNLGGGPSGTNRGYNAPPTPYGTGSVPMPTQTGQGSAVFVPPAASGLPNQGGGPFVNWNQQGANLPSGYVPPPPPFPVRRAGPILSEGARSLLIALMWGVGLGSLIVGLLLLFLHAYDQQRVQGSAEALRQVIAQGEKAFHEGNLQQAAAKFEQALQAGPDSDVGKNARTDLAVTYNLIGVHAYEHKDFQSAEEYWNRTLTIDPANKNAHDNLGKLYDRLGDKDQAQQEWRQSGDNGRAGAENPAAPQSDTTIESRNEAAHQEYNAGVDAYQHGDIDAAREHWMKAVGEAPGLQWSQRAQQSLNQLNKNQTSDSPFFH